ncbi:MAG TPA: hypothetical protein VFG83_18725 [Kofleriaceae bacterium]|nr:hypothetical protein [Kofleriaceae bacterium]
MKLAKIVLSVLVIAAFPAMGCGGDDDPGTTPDIDSGGGPDVDGMTGPPTVDESGDHYTYVASAINVPTTSAERETLGFDYNGDDQVDNQLGVLLTLADSFLGTQELVDTQVAVGSFILLADVQATSLETATGVGFQVFLGENAMPEPCPGGDTSDPTACGLHLQGDATFDVSADSPPNAQVVGQIVNGNLSAGPGDVSLSLNIVEGGAPLNLNLVQAQVSGTVSADGVMTGVLGGAITQESIDNDILPVVQMFMNDAFTADCNTDNADMTCECTSGSTGETLQAFDIDDSCDISVEDLKNSSLVMSGLKADLDLFDANGDPGQDGVNDSLSAGLGFTAVKGTFDVAQ